MKQLALSRDGVYIVVSPFGYAYPRRAMEIIPRWPIRVIEAQRAKIVASFYIHAENEGKEDYPALFESNT